MTVYSLDILLSQFGTKSVHCFMSSSNCWFLTCIQVSQEAGQVVWYSHLFKNFSVCCDPHKGFSVVNEARIDVFLEFSYCDSMDVGNLISGSSAFSKSSLNIWKFSIHILLKTRQKPKTNNKRKSHCKWRQWQPTPVLLPAKSCGQRAWQAAVHGV